MRSTLDSPSPKPLICSHQAGIVSDGSGGNKPVSGIIVQRLELNGNYCDLAR